MKVLLCSKYDRAGASTRYRTLQYLPGLQERGVEVTVRPLLGSGYVEALYSGAGWGRANRIKALLGRVEDLCASESYDLIWMEKELFPWLPAWAELLLWRLGIPYVVDYDDAIFHTYDLNPNPLVRTLLGRKIDSVMAHASAVVAGNGYLAERARSAGARRVEVLPTVVDLERYPRLEKVRGDRPFTLGWIGSPSTENYLLEIQGPLAAFCGETGARLVAVGARPGFSIPGVPLEVRPWSEDAELAEMSAFDVGLMPLVDDPWSRGKCGFKLIQYMGCGLPVIASAVGANMDIVVEGGTGFLARGGEDWLAALRQAYAGGEELRRHLGEAGRSRMERLYSLQATLDEQARILKQAAGFFPCGPSSQGSPRSRSQLHS